MQPLGSRALLDYPWIEPPPGSALISDLRITLLALGARHVSVIYSGGSLTSLVNHLKASNSLTILPYSVVFSTQEISSISLDLDHPPRSLAILRSGISPAPATTTRFAQHLVAAFSELRAIIHQKVQAVSWGRIE